MLLLVECNNPLGFFAPLISRVSPPHTHILRSSALSHVVDGSESSEKERRDHVL